MSEHDDADRYRKEKKERLRRMSVAELVNALAVAPPDPNQPKVDVSWWSDQQLIVGWLDLEIASAGEELVARANVRRVSVADYIADYFCRDIKSR